MNNLEGKEWYGIGLDWLNDWRRNHPGIPFELLFRRFEIPDNHKRKNRDE